MVRYRTEVFIPTDRLINLQLPDHFPEGRAVVTVQFLSGPAEPEDEATAREEDPDELDVEWWEEFDDEPGRLD